MNWMERRKQLEALDLLNERLEQIYQKREIGETSYFIAPDGHAFLVSALPDYPALVVEHAEDEATAAKKQLEDGDMYFLDEWDEEALFHAVSEEVEM